MNEAFVATFYNFRGFPWLRLSNDRSLKACKQSSRYFASRKSPEKYPSKYSIGVEGKTTSALKVSPSLALGASAVTNKSLEYEELDANIATELVVRAKSTHMAPPTNPISPYTAPQYNQYPPQVPSQQQPPPQAQPTPHIANLITSLDGPALQKLLGAMSQNPQTPQNPQNPYQQPQQGPQQQQQQQQPDLAALLANASRQQPPQQAYPYSAQQQPQQQQYNAQAVNQAFANNPTLASLLGGAVNRGAQQSVPQPQQQFQSGQQPNYQNIMEQLGRWKQ